MRDTRKSVKKNRGKRASKGEPQRAGTLCAKKGIYVGMISGGSTLTGNSRWSIKTYKRNTSLKKRLTWLTEAHLQQLYP